MPTKEKKKVTLGTMADDIVAAGGDFNVMVGDLKKAIKKNNEVYTSAIDLATKQAIRQAQSDVRNDIFYTPTTEVLAKKRIEATHLNPPMISAEDLKRNYEEKAKDMLQEWITITSRKPVGDCDEEDVAKERDYYGTKSGTFGRKERLWGAIFEKVAETDKLVKEVMTNDQLSVLNKEFNGSKDNARTTN